MTIVKIVPVVLAVISLCMADISGIVTDTGTTPISGAVVRLEKGGQTATTGADGGFTIVTSAAILHGKSTSRLNGISAGITGNVMAMIIAHRAVVEVMVFNLKGKELSIARRMMDAGRHDITLPRQGAGIYLYKVKAGNNAFLLKANAIGGKTYGMSISSQGSPPNSLVKQIHATAAIDDVIAATKTGYLNYRMGVKKSDTSGIAITMIVSAGTITDTDGNVYQTVKIGNQEWMAENLKVTKYNDGSPIAKILVGSTWDSCLYTNTPSFCYYNNTTKTDSIKKYGALYNWYAVSSGNPKKIAPTGWHVPSDSEWTILEKYLVLNGYNWDGTKDTTRQNKIAKTLSAKTDWVAYTTAGTIGRDVTMNNSSGFSAIPGGGRYIEGGDCNSRGFFGYWWCATERDTTNAWYRFLYFDCDYLDRYYDRKNCGFSVRLVRD
jgi:uncharacterized protein (TIGR02145 family)